MIALIIPLMMFLGRSAGSNLLGLKTVWGLLFAFPIALTSMAMFALPWWGFSIAFLISWRGFEFGHGTFDVIGKLVKELDGTTPVYYDGCFCNVYHRDGWLLPDEYKQYTIEVENPSRVSL